MNRSPAPTGTSAGRQSAITSTSAQVSRTTALSRWPSSVRGRCRPGVSTSTSWASGRVTMPRTACRVVCGRLEVIAIFSPTRALVSVDLPALGRPTRLAKPEREVVTRPSCQAARSLFLSHSTAWLLVADPAPESSNGSWAVLTWRQPGTPAARGTLSPAYRPGSVSPGSNIRRHERPLAERRPAGPVRTYERAVPPGTALSTFPRPSEPPARRGGTASSAAGGGDDHRGARE